MGGVGCQVSHHALTWGQRIVMAIINLLVQPHSLWKNKADECEKQRYPFARWLSKCRVLVLDPLSSWIMKELPEASVPSEVDRHPSVSLTSLT